MLRRTILASLFQLRRYELFTILCSVVFLLSNSYSIILLRMAVISLIYCIAQMMAYKAVDIELIVVGSGLVVDLGWF